jgi:hypothetical protein
MSLACFGISRAISISGALCWGSLHALAAPPLNPTAARLAAQVSVHTPYLIGDLGAHDAHSARGLTAWWRSIAPARAQLLDAALKATAPADRAVLEALIGRLGATERLSALGLSESPAVLIYGLGLAPAALVAVESPEALKGWLSRVTAGLAHGFEPRSHSSGVYWRRAFQRWTLLARFVPLEGGGGGALQVALLPRGGEALLTSAFLSPPRAPLGAAVRERFEGLSDDASPGGWLDLEALMSALLSTPSAPLKESAEAFGLPLPGALLGGCADDLTRLTRGVRAVAFGARVAAGEVLTHLTLSPELRSLAQALRAPPEAPAPLDLRDPVLMSPPALGDGGALHIDVSLRALGLLDVAEAIEGWRGSPPWTCPLLKTLNRLTPAQPGALTAPLRALSPHLAPLSGLSVHLNGVPQGAQGAQVSLEGWAELRHAQPVTLITLLSALSLAPSWLTDALPAPAATPLGPHGPLGPLALKGAPAAWPSPSLSLSSRGLLLTLDPTSLPVHALARSRATSPAPSAGSAQGPSSAPPLISVQLSPTAAVALTGALDQYRARLKALARPQGAEGAPPQAPPEAPPQGPHPAPPSFDRVSVRVTPEGLLIEKRLTRTDALKD